MYIKVWPRFISIITFGFAKGLTIYPFIILKYERDLKDPYLINHEKIHIYQQREMLIIFFYIWYLLEWIIKRSYNKLSFERESYINELNLNYLKTRKIFSWIKYIRK